MHDIRHLRYTLKVTLTEYLHAECCGTLLETTRVMHHVHHSLLLYAAVPMLCMLQVKCMIHCTTCTSVLAMHK